MSRARILADYVSSGDELADKAPIASPTFTGTVAGVTKTHVGLSNVDNTSDSTKQAATLTAATKSDVGLGNVDNDSTSTIRSGNAATATALATSRNIGGVGFDGSANIDLPGVNTSGSQATSGNAATATLAANTTALANPRNIGGAAFDGTSDINIKFLENNTSDQTLSGTYSTERMYLNDSYQLTGNVTVNNHLALGSITDKDIEITNDSSARTIDGSGTLESGELLDKDRTDLTGMTGELGSVVTGSPNLNLTTGTLGSGVTGSPNLNLTTGTLGSGVTFPSGHVLQVQYIADNTAATAASDVPGYSTNLTIDITPASIRSKFICFWDIAWNGGVGFGVRLKRDATQVYQSPFTWLDVQTAGRSRGSWMYLDSPSTTSEITYLVIVSTEGGGSVSICPNTTKSHMTIMEIA